IPIKDRLNTASVVEIADFYNNTIQEEHLKNPDLGSYGLLKITSSNSPDNISDDARRKTLEAMVSKNESMSLAGKRAFQFLSLKTVIAVVDFNLDEKEEEVDGNREDMLNSAMIKVIEKTSGIDQRSEISDQVVSLAQEGIFLYLCEKHDMPLAINSIVDPAKGISLIKEIEMLRNVDSFSSKELEEYAKELSEETGIASSEVFYYLMRKESFEDDDISDKISEEMGSIKGSDGNDDCKKIDERIDIKEFLSTLHGGRESRLNNERKTKRQIRILALKYGLEDGIERTNGEVGKEFSIGREAIRLIEKRVFGRLRYSGRRKKLQGYL
ncbi:MAG: hypothetical protein Q8P29_00480, partial [Candidatus Levybacteria bacterium]|nr:hypothetical protein [Candidatus Levybacteria bacterium]